MGNSIGENKLVTIDELEELLCNLRNESENKENFTLNITHDMRSHLNVIISALQFIEHNSLNITTEKKYMNIIKRNSYKILKLINNLIDTSRLENNFYKLEKRNIDIVSMIEGTVECIEKYSLEKNIQLIFDTNKEYIGSGIGLDLTNYLVKAHGGNISINSVENEGSEFIVTIPRVLEEHIETVDNSISSKIQMLEIEFSDIYLSE